MHLKKGRLKRQKQCHLRLDRGVRSALQAHNPICKGVLWIYWRDASLSASAGMIALLCIAILRIWYYTIKTAAQKKIMKAVAHIFVRRHSGMERDGTLEAAEILLSYCALGGFRVARSCSERHLMW